MNQYSIKEVLHRLRAPRIGIALTSISLIAGTAALYSPVSSAAIFDELTKNQLADIRGKFLLRNNTLQYFGLSMNTSWGTPSRPTYSSGLKLDFDLRGNSPAVSVTRNGSVGEKIADAKIVEPDTAPQQISGSVQSIQVGGNNNTLGNQLDLDVNGSDKVVKNTDPRSEAVADITHSLPVANATSSLGAGVETYKSDDGIVTQYVNTSNSIGYAVKNDVGTVVQRLGANSLNKHQLLQSIKVAGNMQHVVNTIALDVRLNDRAQLKQTALGFTGNSALMGLR